MQYSLIHSPLHQILHLLPGQKPYTYSLNSDKIGKS
jgi:hypothetical protein